MHEIIDGVGINSATNEITFILLLLTELETLSPSPTASKESLVRVSEHMNSMINPILYTGKSRKYVTRDNQDVLQLLKLFR